MTATTQPTFRRAVVTGGAGFIGSHICDELVGAGTEVVCVDNFCTGNKAAIGHLLGNPLFTLVETDVSASLDIGETAADLVLHLASPATIPDFARLPMETLLVGGAGTHHALRLALRCGARFVLASTSEVYGDPAEHPQRETYWGHVNPIGPRSMYDEAKRYAEAMTVAFGRAHDLSTGVVRIFNTYGPRLRLDDPRMIPRFVTQSLSNEPLTIHGDGWQTRSPCYVEDTVRGILAIARSGHHEPINIGNTQEVAVRDLAVQIRDLVGSRSELVFEAADGDDPARRRPDITRAREVLDWEPQVSLLDGLKRTISAMAAELESGRRHTREAPGEPE